MKKTVNVREFRERNLKFKQNEACFQINLRRVGARDNWHRCDANGPLSQAKNERSERNSRRHHDVDSGDARAIHAVLVECARAEIFLSAR